MDESTKLKDRFVRGLREFLQQSYGFEKVYTFGKKNEFGIEEDLGGFLFNKLSCDNLYSFDLKKKKEILNDINAFAISNRFESKFDNEEYLKLKIGEKNYMIYTYIEEGYAGEISIIVREPMDDFIKKILSQ